MADDRALELAGVVKTFGSVRALDGLDLEVPAGEVHGFVGPNGAGKSTTLRVLLGLLRADRGTVRVLGADAWRDAATLHARMAYVPGDVNLWPGLTGGEVIDLLGRMRGGPDERRRATLIERFGLDPGCRVRHYSKGNRQKVAVVAAFATPADLYLLDEPTSGLDPLMEVQFRRCVREATAEGATVLLSSHVLAEVETLSDRISVVREGRIVLSGALADLQRLARTTISARTVTPAVGIAELDGVHHVRVEGPDVRFEVEGHRLDAAVAALSGLGVLALTAHPPTLEELFLREYGEVAEVEESA